MSMFRTLKDLMVTFSIYKSVLQADLQISCYAKKKHSWWSHFGTENTVTGHCLFLKWQKGLNYLRTKIVGVLCTAVNT